jgi:hypothetical protein
VLEQLPLRHDLLLLGLAAALYLGNTAQLLYVNEVLFVRRASGRWQAVFPSRTEILGRFLVLPPPLRPSSAMLRMSYPRADQPSSAPVSVTARLDERLSPLGSMRWLSTLLLVQIFVGLPAAYAFGRDHLGLLLGALALVYAQAVALVLMMTANRRALALRRTEVAGLAFECLACLPYAVNLYRRLSAKAADASWCVLDVARELLAPEDLRRFHAEITAQVDVQLAWAGESAAGAQRLREFRAAIDQRAVRR